MKTPKMQVEKGILMHIEYTLPETNSSHLKMDGLNTIVSFWDGLFSGDMLVSGMVYTFCFLISPNLENLVFYMT